MYGSLSLGKIEGEGEGGLSDVNHNFKEKK